MNPKNKPTFRRGGLLRVMKHKTNTATSWRRPKGIDSKQRKKLKNKPRVPSTGYGAPRITRNLHPSGLSEVRVYNADGLQGLDSKKHAVMIASGVGNRKRLLIQNEAKKAGLRVLNEKKIELKKKVKKKVEKKEEAKKEVPKKAVEKKEEKKEAPKKPAEKKEKEEKKPVERKEEAKKEAPKKEAKKVNKK